MRRACLVLSVMCAACSSAPQSGIPGLPDADFERAFQAGLDVAAAERCGGSLDGGAVRYHLVEDAKRRGLSDAVADRAGVAFDKTRSEYAQRLAGQSAFCVSSYVAPEARLAGYAKGEFPAPP